MIATYKKVEDIGDPPGCRRRSSEELRDRRGGDQTSASSAIIPLKIIYSVAVLKSLFSLTLGSKLIRLH